MSQWWKGGMNEWMKHSDGFSTQIESYCVHEKLILPIERFQGPQYYAPLLSIVSFTKIERILLQTMATSSFLKCVYFDEK